jgi:hypothetical protein
VVETQLPPKKKVNDFFYRVGWWLKKCFLKVIINIFLKTMEVVLMMTPNFILFKFSLDNYFANYNK